ncbi:MAG: hypothetical protein ACLQPH_15810, partial [Acidimicrobiales bacterium]
MRPSRASQGVVSARLRGGLDVDCLFLGHCCIEGIQPRRDSEDRGAGSFHDGGAEHNDDNRAA